MINRIMPRDLACLMCRLEGRSFCGTEYEMAFHLINTHPNVQTWMPLPRLVALVMEEVVSPPPQMRRLFVCRKYFLLKYSSLKRT